MFIDLRAENRHRLPRLGFGDAGFSARHHLVGVRLRLAERRRREGRDRKKEVAVPPQPAEARLDDADDRERLAIHVDDAADDRGIRVEATLPERIGDERLARRGGMIVGSREIAAAPDVQAERGQITPRSTRRVRGQRRPRLPRC